MATKSLAYFIRLPYAMELTTQEKILFDMARALFYFESNFINQHYFTLLRTGSEIPSNTQGELELTPAKVSTLSKVHMSSM